VEENRSLLKQQLVFFVTVIECVINFLAWRLRCGQGFRPYAHMEDSLSVKNVVFFRISLSANCTFVGRSALLVGELHL
jgi:hypothetical protein